MLTYGTVLCLVLLPAFYLDNGFNFLALKKSVLNFLLNDRHCMSNNGRSWGK